MNPEPTPPLKTASSVLARSAGLKLIIICGLVLLMAIPVMFIGAVAYERSGRADDVMRDVSQRYGGQQTLVGPILAVPYSTHDPRTLSKETGWYIVYPDTGEATFGSIDVEVKTQSLFKVPVYTARGTLSAVFEAPLKRLGKSDLKLDMTKAKLLVSVSDVRGLKQDIALRGPKGETRLFEPAQLAVGQISIPSDIYESATEARSLHQVNVVPDRAYDLPHMGTWLSIDAGDWVTQADTLDVTAELVLSGAEMMSITPFGKSTQVNMTSTWPDPGFQGEFTPLNRDISETGFSADWTMPYTSRGIAAQGKAHEVLGPLQRNQVRVKFVNTDNPYQTVNRALKYSVLFIGMVFLAYFLFEVIVGVPVHPAQYILIGLAQAIFYLLLLAFAERVGFTGAFVIAALATISATAGYAGAVFGGREYIAKAGAAFAVVYGLLFVLMKMEDFALMIGAMASFIAIAGTMYLTRNMNWYGGEKA